MGPLLCFLVCRAINYVQQNNTDVVTVSDVPDLNDPTTWEFYIAHSTLGTPLPSRDPVEVLQVLKEKGKAFGEPFRSVILNIPEDTKMYNQKLSYWIPTQWDNHDGRVTMAGDAAHPMPPCKLLLSTLR
jgi:2-polyprenyl-6-methoxyphenol hydroxylase-like FAD-dependent oxidoreductase